MLVWYTDGVKNLWILLKVIPTRREVVKVMAYITNAD